MNTLIMLLLQIPVVLAGLIVVPIAMLFATPVTLPDGRQSRALPHWAIWFDNKIDGDIGDARGWWSYNCAKQSWFGLISNLQSTDYLARYWWLAIRNPANNFKRFVAGVDCTELTVARYWRSGTVNIDADAGSRGIKLIIFTPGVWSFECAYDYGNGRGFYVQLGHKISMTDLTKYRYDDPKRMKGVTFECNPFKRFE